MPQKKNDGQNLKGALTYLLGFLSGIYFLLTEKENDFIRFHAMQSTIVFGALFIANFIPIVGFFTIPVGLILWVLLMYKAYSGEKYKLPYIGDFAETQLTK